MDFRFQVMTDLDRADIRHWHYAAPYDFYDLDADPEDLAEFMSPAPDELQLAALDDAGRVGGFMVFSAVPGRAGTFAVGLGLRPDLTGQKGGGAFLADGLAEARERILVDRFVVRVAEFNKRALRVYERAGFKIVRRYMQPTNGSRYLFIELERAAESGPERSIE